MEQNSPTFALWMPTLNEIQGLEQIWPQIDKNLFSEIIVVDGGSTDGTIEFCQKHQITLLTQPNKGMPDASEFAYQHTKSDIIIIFTPDGNSLPELLAPLCHKMREGYDMVIVSRYLDDAASHDDGILTSFGNLLFTGLVNVIFKAKYTDVLVAFRGYRRTAIEKMRLMDHTNEHWLRKRFFYMNGWELGSTIRAARLKLKTAEMPGNEPERIGGRSKLSIVKNGLGSLLQILHDLVYFRQSDSVEQN